MLQLHSQSLDLLLVMALALVGLVLRHLEAPQVVCHNLQLLLQLDDLELAHAGPLVAHFQVALGLHHLLLGLVVHLVGILGLLLRLLQLLGQPHQLLLIVRRTVLQHFLHPVTVVGSGRGLVQLLAAEHELGLGVLEVLLELLHPPVQPVELSLGRHDLRLLRLLLHLGLGELLTEDIHLHLKVLALLLSSVASSSVFSSRIFASRAACSQLSQRSIRLSFSTFMACIFFLIASIVQAWTIPPVCSSESPCPCWPPTESSLPM